MTSTPLPPVAFLTSSGHCGSREFEREIAAEVLQPRAAIRIGRGADHQRRAHQLADLHAHEADAGARALYQQRLTALETARGHHRVVHGEQRERQARRLFVAHGAAGNVIDAAGVGRDVFREPARARRHHPVAGPEADHRLADGFDLAGALETELSAATAAGKGALGREQIGAVEARRPRGDQNFARSRLRLRHIADFGAVVADDSCFHARFLHCVRPARLSGALARRHRFPRDGFPLVRRVLSSVITKSNREDFGQAVPRLNRRDRS